MAGRTFAISTIFKIIEKVRGPMRIAQRAVTRFKNALKRDLRSAQVSVNRFANNLKSRIGGAFKYLAGAGLAILAGGLAYATREFIKFDHALTAASAKFRDMKPENVAQNLEILGASARKVGAETQFSATQAAEGLDFLAMAGMSSTQAMKLLPGIVDLATVANVDLGRATDIATDSLGAFQLAAGTDEQIKKNLIRINDVFARTVTTSNATLEDLFESVKKGGPAFKAAGQSVETFATLSGIMASSSMKAAESGTALRNIMLRLAKADSIPKARREMKRLGVVIDDGTGNFKNIIDILIDFKGKTKDMGNIQRKAALGTIFGAKTITALDILLGKSVKTLRGYQATVLDNAGASKRMADVIRTSLSSQLKILQSSLIETGFQFLEGFKKKGVGSIKALTEAVRGFDPRPIAQGIRNVAGAIADFWERMKPFAPAIKIVIAAFIAYKVALYAVAIAQAVVAATNPISLIAIGVIALIAGLAILVAYWDQLSAAVTDNPMLGIIIGLISPLLIVALVISKIINNWDNLVAGMMDNWDNLVAGMMDKVIVLEDVFNRMKMWIVGVIDKTGDLTKSLIKAMLSPLEYFMDLEGAFDVIDAGVNRMIKSLKLLLDMTMKFSPLKGIFDLGRGVTRMLFEGQEERKKIAAEKQGDLAEASRETGMGELFTPQGVMTSSITETFAEKISRSFLTITDQTGKAEMSGDATPPGIVFQSSGGE